MVVLYTLTSPSSDGAKEIREVKMGKVTRRDFIVKGGKYALFTATAMEVLFTSKRAMAQSGGAPPHPGPQT